MRKRKVKTSTKMSKKVKSKNSIENSMPRSKIYFDTSKDEENSDNEVFSNEEESFTPISVHTV